MPKMTWKEIETWIHAIKNERTVICGLILRLQKTTETLKEADEILKQMENRFQLLIERHVKEAE